MKYSTTRYFDEIEKARPVLAKIFERDGMKQFRGAEDYLIRAVDEATINTNRAVYWTCEYCERDNISTNAQCSSCGKKPNHE